MTDKGGVVLDTKAQATQSAAALQFGELGIYRYRTDGVVSAMDEGAFHIFGLDSHFPTRKVS